MATVVRELEVLNVTSDGGCGRGCDSEKCRTKYTITVAGVEKPMEISAEMARKIIKRMEEHRMNRIYKPYSYLPDANPVFLKLVLED